MLNPGLYNYWIVIVLMMTGLYLVIARGNLVKKLIGLNIFQVSVFMLYISMGRIDGGTAPILHMNPPPKHHASAAGKGHHPPKGRAHQAEHKKGPKGHTKPHKASHQAHTKAHDKGHHADDKGHSQAPSDPMSKYYSSGDHHGTPVFKGKIYSNPVPHVLILTAIVVGIATTALGLALVVRIYESYGTIEEDEIQSQDEEA